MYHLIADRRDAVSRFIPQDAKAWNSKRPTLESLTCYVRFAKEKSMQSLNSKLYRVLSNGTGFGV